MYRRALVRLLSFYKTLGQQAVLYLWITTMLCYTKLWAKMVDAEHWCVSKAVGQILSLPHPQKHVTAIVYDVLKKKVSCCSKVHGSIQVWLACTKYLVGFLHSVAWLHQHVWTELGSSRLCSAVLDSNKLVSAMSAHGVNLVIVQLAAPWLQHIHTSMLHLQTCCVEFDMHLQQLCTLGK